MKESVRHPGFSPVGRAVPRAGPVAAAPHQKDPLKNQAGDPSAGGGGFWLGGGAWMTGTG